MKYTDAQAMRYARPLMGVPASDPVEAKRTAQPVSAATDDSLNCPLCDYDLRGLPANRCPECGYAFDPEELRLLVSFGSIMASSANPAT